jgi:predicted nucleic acid-binding Zn ribbon protein
VTAHKQHWLINKAVPTNDIEADNFCVGISEATKFMHRLNAAAAHLCPECTAMFKQTLELE